MMKKIKAIIFIMLLTAGCGNEVSRKDKLTVAAAASMKHAAMLLADSFVKNQPGISVEVIASASGTVTAQILNGAPFDIFMSADMKYPELIFRKGFAEAAPAVYARGNLILMSRHGIDRSKGLSLLSDRSIRRIAVANPDTAPYGRAAAEALKNAGIDTRGRLITGESIMQAASYSLSSADAAFISKSMLYTPAMERYRDSKYWIEVAPSHYTAIEQGIVILKNCADKKLCRRFYDFVLSAEGKKILKENGFSTD